MPNEIEFQGAAENTSLMQTAAFFHPRKPLASPKQNKRHCSNTAQKIRHTGTIQME